MLFNLSELFPVEGKSKTYTGPLEMTHFKGSDCSYKIVKKAETQKITGTTNYKKTTASKAFKLNAKANTKLTYKSSNTKVATVDKNGKVTIKGKGKAVITVSAAATSEYQAATKKVTIQVTAKKTAKK